MVAVRTVPPASRPALVAAALLLFFCISQASAAVDPCTIPDLDAPDAWQAMRSDDPMLSDLKSAVASELVQSTASDWDASVCKLLPNEAEVDLVQACKSRVSQLSPCNLSAVPTGGHRSAGAMRCGPSRRGWASHGHRSIQESCCILVPNASPGAWFLPLLQVQAGQGFQVLAELSIPCVDAAGSRAIVEGLVAAQLA